MRACAVTLVALTAVALFARAGVAQTSRPTKATAGTSAVAPSPTVAPADEKLIVRPSADPKTTTRPAGATIATPVGFDTQRVALSLAIVLALIVALRWASKRIFGRTILGRSSRAVQVLSRNVISPKQQLLVVQVGRRLVVVGDSGQQMTPLCEITDVEEMAALVGQIQEEKRESVSNAFGSLFGRAGSEFSRESEPPRSAGVTEEDDSTPSPVTPSPVQDTREELSGLMDKVRMMSRQFRRT